MSARLEAIVRWADRRCFHHLDQLPDLPGADRDEQVVAFEAFPFHVKVACCARLLRAMPYAVVVLAVCEVRPGLWRVVNEAHANGPR